MKSKSSTFILIIVVLAVIGAGVYFFVIKKPSGTTPAGLVSSNASTSAVVPGQSTTGSEVVTILRNLSAIRLDDSVFRNPAFALLTDISISIPPITNQGRRNPFAPVGTDTSAAVTPVSTGGTPLTGPSF